MSCSADSLCRIAASVYNASSVGEDPHEDNQCRDDGSRPDRRRLDDGADRVEWCAAHGRKAPATSTLLRATRAWLRTAPRARYTPATTDRSTGPAAVGREERWISEWSSRAASDAGGYADAPAQDTFCANTYCWITTVYDQSPKHNDLTQAPRGGFSGPALGGFNNLPIADAAPVTDHGPQGLRRLHRARDGHPR